MVPEHGRQPDSAGFEVRILVELSGPARVFPAGVEGLRFEGPFGSWVLSSSAVSKAARDVAGTITVEATGVKLLLGPARDEDRSALFAFIDKQIQRRRSEEG